MLKLFQRKQQVETAITQLKAEIAAKRQEVMVAQRQLQDLRGELSTAMRSVPTLQARIRIPDDHAHQHTLEAELAAMEASIPRLEAEIATLVAQEPELQHALQQSEQALQQEVFRQHVTRACIAGESRPDLIEQWNHFVQIACAMVHALARFNGEIDQYYVQLSTAASQFRLPLGPLPQPLRPESATYPDLLAELMPLLRTEYNKGVADGAHRARQVQLDLEHPPAVDADVDAEGWKAQQISGRARD
jgi:capsule polysaccharide export protein KpsE/RkpR